MKCHKILPRLVARIVLASAAFIQPPAKAGDPPLAVINDVTETARNRQAVTAAFDRWAAGGSEFFEEMLAPGVVWTIAGSSATSGTYFGLSDFRARAVLPFTSRLRTPVRPTLRTVWADGDHVITHWLGEAVAGDGLPYRNRYVWIFRMREGKAVEVTAFLDLAPYEDVIRRVPAPVAGTRRP